MSVIVVDIKRLCDMIGVGMMDCKKVFNEVEGDFDKVIEIFCKKG